jgi:hypothetical protein
MQTATGSSVAAGAIVACLVDMLVTKGVLSRQDAGQLLSNSLAWLARYGTTPDTVSARETISSIATMYT